MNNHLNEYKHFIDGLVKWHESISAKLIRTKPGQAEPESDWAKYQKLIGSLSAEERELLAKLLQHERDGGIHDTLVFLTDGEYHLSRGGIELAWEPFGTEMYFDFVARIAGQEWPEHADES